MRKIIAAIACLTVIGADARAQEFNFWLNGGWQGLTCSIKNGRTNLLAGGAFGLGWTIPLSHRWSIISGVTGGSYGDRVTMNDGVYNYNQVDITGSAFQYSIGTTGYKETQHFFSFGGIPIMLQYHTTGSRSQWYFNGGGKLLLPFNAHVQSSSGQLQLSGYYPDFNVNVSNLAQYGFGTVDNWRGSTTYGLKTALSWNMETGICLMLSHRTKLYTGVYFEYGLDNIKNGNGPAPLVPYSPNGFTGMHAGSVLNTPNAGDARAAAFGLQVKLGIGHCSIGTKARTGGS